MSSFAVLDVIADAFNPLQGLLALLLIGHAAWQRRWTVAANRSATLAGLLVIVYGWRMLLQLLDPQRLAGVAYSTHTAFALALSVFLAACMPRLWALWLGLLTAYLCLVRWQGYHAMSDVVLTLLLVGPLAWWAVRIRVSGPSGLR